MIAFRLLCAAAWLAPLAVVRDGYDPSNLPKAAFIQILVAGALLAWMFAPRRPAVGESPAQATGHAPFEAPLLALLVWSALSLLWARDPQAGVGVWLQWAAAGLAYVTLSRLSPPPALFGRLLFGVFAVAVVVGALGLAQAAFDIRWVPQAFPPASTFANKNIAAGFVVAALPLGLIVFAPGTFAGVPGAAGSKRQAVAWAVGATVIVSYVVVSLTRAAWLALGVQVLAAVALTLRGRFGLPRAALRATGIAGAVLVLGAGALIASGKGASAWGRLTGLWQGLQPASDSMTAGAVSVRGRHAIWRNTIEMVRDRSVRGVGLGNHALWYPRYANKAVPDPLYSTSTNQADFVHNDYLQVAAELGLPGLGLLVWLVIGIARTGKRALAAEGQPNEVLRGAALLSLVGLAVDALVSFPFQLALAPLLFVVLLATLRALLPVERAATDAVPTTDEPRPWLAWAALLLVAGLTMHHVQRLRADRHMFRMFRAERQNDWAAAEREARAALDAEPSAIEPLFVLGQATLAGGRAGEALGPLEKLVARRPYYGNALRNLAVVYSAGRMNDKAEACYRRVVELDPRDALSHYKLGLLQQQRGASGEARQTLQRAAELAPENATYQYRLALVSMQAGAAADAENALKRALARAPHNAEFHKLMGVLLVQSAGRLAEAAPYFARALELNPSISDAERMRQLIAQVGAARR